MFDGPEYASYIARMRELRLERKWEDGDLFVDVHLKHVYGPDMHGRHVPFGDTEYADRDSVWLPRLDQWLDLYAEAFVAKHPTFTQAVGWKYLARRDALNAIAAYWTENPAMPVEEAAARRWMAVTGRTVTT